MSKTIAQAIASTPLGAQLQPPQADPRKTVKGLFMLFHGWYGNLFLSRYEVGDKDASGKDRGVLSAMTIWQNALDRFDGETVRAAADRCQEAHPKYPPTLPEFVAICRAIQPRQAERVALPMSDGLKSSYTAKARADAMARYRENIAAEAGVVKTGEGSPGLRVLVSKAVALAGGDEVATLRSFEREA